MRHIGRPLPQLTLMPQAQALRDAAAHQQTGQALAAVHSTGIRKGVYRFSTAAEADAQRLQGLADVIAANAALQRSKR